MNWSWALIGVCGALVLAGLLMLVHDLRRRRPDASSRAAERMRRPATSAAIVPPPESTADVTIVQRASRSRPAPPSGHRSGRSGGFDELVASVAAIRAETVDAETAEEGQRWPSLPNRWRALEPMVETAVARINESFGPVALQVAAPGEPGWSFKNRGYGTYRRVMVGGRSLAWLRAELGHGGQVMLKVRAHQIEQALLNAQSALPSDGATPNDVSDALAQALRPAAEYAAWVAPKRQAEAAAGDEVWTSIDTVTREAVTQAAAMVKASGVDLVAQAQPAWDETTGRQRWRLALRQGEAQIGLVDIALAARAIEVTISAEDRTRNGLDRRRRLDLAGLSATALADAIASSAWPVIADAQNQGEASKLGYAG